jgi:hypothetical protein
LQSAGVFFVSALQLAESKGKGAAKLLATRKPETIGHNQNAHILFPLTELQIGFLPFNFPLMATTTFSFSPPPPPPIHSTQSLNVRIYFSIQSGRRVREHKINFRY